MKSFSSVILLGALSLSAADLQPPSGTEGRLRARLDEFYKLVAAQKYREAERLVAPESRDAWYSSEKPAILDYHVSEVKWGKDFRTAEVSMTSQTRVRRATLGEITLNLPFTSHWVLEGGKWWWYVPKVYERRTAFGTMRVNAESAERSGVNLQEMIAKGPKAAEVAGGVKITKASLKIGLEMGASDGTVLMNTLPGEVNLTVNVPPGSGISAELTKTVLAYGGKATLIVRRTSTDFKPTTVSVLVSPTQEKINIRVTGRT